MVLYHDEELPGSWELLNDDGEIVLKPAPTDSPNDPLTWSSARKLWNGLLVCYLTALTAATANDAGSAGQGMLSTEGISEDYENKAAGVLFASIAFVSFVTAPLPWLAGRKILYLLCMLSGLAGAIWFAKTTTPTDSVLNQIFVGASESCAEANVQLSLSDMYFEHQLGTALGFYVLATSVGTYVGPLIASFIADGVGWRWIGWCAAIVSAGTIIVLLFGMDETMFDRILPSDRLVLQEWQAQQDAEETADSHPGSASEKEDQKDTKDNKDLMSSSPAIIESGALAPERSLRANEPRKTYWQRIQPITPASNLKGWGIKQYFRRLFSTCTMLCYPAVLFSGLQWGAQDAWLSFYMSLEEEYWTEAPWNYGDAADGIMAVPSLIGATLGCIYGGWLNDKFVMWLARRRGGHREAEDRLWFLIPTAFVSFVGMLVFGIGTERGWSWPAPYVALGFCGFGFGCCGDLSMSYVAEAYPDAVIEQMACIALLNNSMACLFTFIVDDWLEATGVQNAMIACALLDLFFILLCIPMLIWGKTFRKWTRSMYLEYIRVRDQI